MTTVAGGPAAIRSAAAPCPGCLVSRLHPPQIPVAGLLKHPFAGPPPGSSRTPVRHPEPVRHLVHPSPGGHSPRYTVVIPTLGRPCLQDCLDALAGAAGPLPDQVVLADDRPHTPDPLPARLPPALADRTVILTLEGRGPAAARNAGWRAARGTEWVAFLDDDVVVGPAWREDLVADLAGQADRVAGVQGTIAVPRRRPPAHRLGTRHRRPGHGPLDHRGHGLPAPRADRRRRLRRTIPPGLPGRRGPRAAPAGPGVAAGPGAGGRPPIRCVRRGAGPVSGPRPGTPTTR